MNTPPLEVPPEYDKLNFSSIAYKIIEGNSGKIYIENTDSHLSSFKTPFANIGVQFSTKNYEINKTKIQPSRQLDYLDILKRKNCTYDFLDIKIYSNPYENNELSLVIIDIGLIFIALLIVFKDYII
ncbi:MAG: hypothetical protein OXF85_00020 [Candidatus Saccharibacteria bacterium]|nr:hypothetical protein [Candidatus Saccharibacteria bacterium]